MDLFILIKGIGGLALFLYGMHVMGDSLSKLSGGKMENILKNLTSTKLRAVILGTLVTAIIQSSSATTVMVVGFVNSEIMKLTQAVGVIMGANIGTTITSWLLSLTGISGDSILIKLLKPTSFSPIMALVGVILIMSGKDDKKKNIGSILIGFAILMFGMDSMSSSVSPLAKNESFTRILTMFESPVLGLMAGAILTAIIQSSSASVGILQALCLTGAVSYGSAIPIIMGQNIGTCVTAIISSIGASKNAKRTSAIHLYFNLLGTVVFMIVFYCLNSFIHFEFLSEPIAVIDVAIIHSLFNIACTIALYPFSDLLVKLATLTIKDNKEDSDCNPSELPKALIALDERFLANPGLAMELSNNAAIEMAKEAKNCLDLALYAIHEYDLDTDTKIRDLEQLTDKYEDILGTYLVKLSGRDLSTEESKILSILLHCSSDFERIADHSLNVLDSVVELKNRNLEFSKNALRELDVLIAAVTDIVNNTTNVFIDHDLKKARYIEPLEEVIDSLKMSLRKNHIKRLTDGECTIELGIVFEDVITNLERISDHCSNIAVCLIQVNDDSFGTHSYLGDYIKHTEWFKEEVKRYALMYQFPQMKEE